MRLGDSKTFGIDNIPAEHLKIANRKLHPFLAIYFTGLLVYGILPDSNLSVLLVPIIKNKAVNLTSLDNYRPIALSNALEQKLL